MLPYFPGRDLYRFMRAHKSLKGHLSEYELWLITKQLVLALKTLYSRDIVHRDIKSENIIFYDDLNIALSNFRLTIKLKNEC